MTLSFFKFYLIYLLKGVIKDSRLTKEKMFFRDEGPTITSFRTEDGGRGGGGGEEKNQNVV